MTGRAKLRSVLSWAFGALNRGCMSYTVQDMMRHRNNGATLGPAHAVNDGTGNQGSGVLLNRFVPNGAQLSTRLRTNRNKTHPTPFVVSS